MTTTNAVQEELADLMKKITWQKKLIFIKYWSELDWKVIDANETDVLPCGVEGAKKLKNVERTVGQRWNKKRRKSSSKVPEVGNLGTYM